VADRKKTEESLFADWRKTNDPQYFRKLYDSMKPLLHDAAKKASFGSNIPESAHKIYAAQNFYDALRTFKPGKGAAIQTHVYGAVHQKAKRLNYLYQNLGHIPEPRAQSIGLFQNEQSYLKSSLGREPSTAEMADRLGWGVKQVANIQREIQKDLALGEGTEDRSFFESSRDEEVLDYLYVPILSRYTPNQLKKLLEDRGIKNVSRISNISTEKADIFNKNHTSYSYDYRAWSSRLLFGHGFIVMEGIKE